MYGPAVLDDASAERKALDLLLRMALIDIATGMTVHEYGYLLTTGSDVIDIWR